MTDSAQAPVRWVVEASADNGSTWLSVGASVWRLNSDGSSSLYPQLPYSVPLPAPAATARSLLLIEAGIAGTEVRVDGRPPLSWVLIGCTDNVYYSLGFFSFSAAGLLGHAHWIRLLWLALLGVDALFNLAAIAAIAFAEPWMWRETAEMGLYVLSLAVLAGGSAFYEQSFIAFLLLYCLLDMGSYAIPGVLLYKRSWAAVLLEQLMTLTAVGLIFCIAAFVFRRRAITRAHSLVLADRRRYDTAWGALRSDPAAEVALMSVRDEAARFLSRTGVIHASRCCRQFVRRGPPRRYKLSESLRNLGLELLPSLPRFASSPPSHSQSEPVRSLDQLYVQAWCLNPILRRKVQQWALESGGCFVTRRLDGTLAFVPFAEAQCDEGGIRWSNVKSSSRAIEKLVRVYNQVGPSNCQWSTMPLGSIPTHNTSSWALSCYAKSDSDNLICRTRRYCLICVGNASSSRALLRLPDVCT